LGGTGLNEMEVNMEYLIPITVVILIFGTKAFKEVKDYLLRKEQIKADALVRAEALRYKNQIELEKLIQNDRENEAPKHVKNNTDTAAEERKSNDRLRY
jgi:hypothetical protein